METVNINSREYKITETLEYADYPLVAADMTARGWEPRVFALTGKRGARKTAFRNSATGEYSIVL